MRYAQRIEMLLVYYAAIAALVIWGIYRGDKERKG
jgi:hypothetical protein